MADLRASLVLLGSVALLAPISLGQDRKIQRSDLPPAVEHTVAAESRGAVIRGFSMEHENGQTYYEAEMTVNGHGRDVLIDKSGAVVEVEEQVPLESISAAVKEGLQAKAGKGEIVKVESITKHDRLVAYEAKVLTGAKKSEVQVGPDGKPLDHEE
jgi:hypothetical protein